MIIVRIIIILSEKWYQKMVDFRHQNNRLIQAEHEITFNLSYWCYCKHRSTLSLTIWCWCLVLVNLTTDQNLPNMESKSRKHTSSRIAFHFHYSLKVVHIKEFYSLFDKVLWNYNPTIIVHSWSVFFGYGIIEHLPIHVFKNTIFIEKDVLATKN